MGDEDAGGVFDESEATVADMRTSSMARWARAQTG